MFDCKKQNFNVTFKFILLLLIIIRSFSSGPLRECLSSEEKRKREEEERRLMLMCQQHPAKAPVVMTVCVLSQRSSSKAPSQPTNVRAAMMLKPRRMKSTLSSCFPGELSSCGRISKKVM